MPNLPDEVAKLADMAGLDLTAEQRRVLDAMLAVREDGTWVHSDVHVRLDHQLVEPVLAARALAGLLLLNQRILWLSHLRRTSHGVLLRLVPLL